MTVCQYSIVLRCPAKKKKTISSIVSKNLYRYRWGGTHHCWVFVQDKKAKTGAKVGTSCPDDSDPRPAHLQVRNFDRKAHLQM